MSERTEDGDPGRGSITVIEPKSGWLAIDWADLWKHRDLFLMLMQRDVKVRYKQTVLGAVWAVIQPVAAAAIFTFVIGRVMRGPTDGIPGFIFYYSGLLPWTFFAAIVSGASQSLLNNERLMTKVYFPRVLVPMSTVGYAGLDFIVAAVVFGVVMAIFGFTPVFRIGPVLAALLCLLLCALGTGAALAALTVKYRDFRFVVPFLLQIWLYASPVIYPLSAVNRISPKAYYLFNLNPLAGAIDGFRAGITGTPLDVTALPIGLAVSLALFAAGLTYFRQVEDYFADIV